MLANETRRANRSIRLEQQTETETDTPATFASYSAIRPPPEVVGSVSLPFLGYRLFLIGSLLYRP